MINIIYLLILFGYIFSHGFFSLNESIILFISVILFIFLLNKPKNFKKVSFFSTKSLLVLSCLLQIILYGGLYQNNYVLIIFSLFLTGINLLLAIFITNNTQKQKTVYFIMFAIALLLRLFMIWSSPKPYIDVYDYLKLGAEGFLQGKNPYSLTFPKLYSNVTPDFYSYLPGTLFTTLPSVKLLKDPRYTFIFSEIITALIVYKLIRKKQNKYTNSIIILQSPISLYLIEQSYIEPLIVLLIITSVFLIGKKKWLLSALSLGILFATKQYLIFLVPLFYRLLNQFKGKKIVILGSFLVALLIILPFLFWNYTDFLHDAVMLQLKFPPRYEGLTFFSLLYSSTGLKYNFLISMFAISFLLFFIYRIKKTDYIYFFYLSSAVYLIIFFFNKWAFLNYYYLVSQLLLIGICLDSSS